MLRTCSQKARIVMADGSSDQQSGLRGGLPQQLDGSSEGLQEEC